MTGDAEADERARGIRDAFDAFNAGDLEAVMKFIDPEITAHVSGQLMNAGSWQGREGFFAMVAAWNEAFAETRYDFQGAEHLDETFSIALVRQHSVGRQSGVPVEMEPAYLIQIVDGSARRFEVYPDRAAALAAYGSPAGTPD